MNNNPSLYTSDLTTERLNIISRLLLDARYSALNDASTKLDDRYTQGCLTFGRQRQAIIQTCNARQYSWLSLSHAGTDVVFKIGSVHIRFFTDDSSNPKKPRVLIPTIAESSQINIFEPNSNEVVLWRFIIERAINDDEDDNVFFIGINEFNEIICRWAFDDAVALLHSISNSTPAEKELKPALITQKIQDNHITQKKDNV